MKVGNSWYWILLVGVLFSCTSLNKIDQIPEDTYLISTKRYESVFKKKANTSAKGIKVDLAVKNDSVFLSSLEGNGTDKTIPLEQIDHLTLVWKTLDLDIFTVPFKIRPSVQDFPTQLNPNFSAAMYVGRRFDIYSVSNENKEGKIKTKLTSMGLGYGAFAGLGSVTMNPFVTNNHINYEYDGFVLATGLATIYDAKRFNLGLAIGLDYLVDKNRAYWIYNNKPWLGLLFGLNLN